MTVKVKSTHSRHIVLTLPAKDVSYELKTAIEEFFDDEFEADFQGDTKIAFTLESDSKFIGLSDESITKHVERIIGEVREANAKYESEMMQKYAEIKIDVPQYHNSGIAMEIATAISACVNRASKYAKEKDFGMAVGCMQDGKDLMGIYDLVDKFKWVSAYKEIRSLDTSLREMLHSIRPKIAQFAGIDDR